MPHNFIGQETKQPGDHRYKLQPTGVSQSAEQTDSQTGKRSAACTGVKSLEFPQFKATISLPRSCRKIRKDSPGGMMNHVGTNSDPDALPCVFHDFCAGWGILENFCRRCRREVLSVPVPLRVTNAASSAEAWVVPFRIQRRAVTPQPLGVRSCRAGSASTSPGHTC